MASHIVSVHKRTDAPPAVKTLSNLAIVPIPPNNPSVHMLYTAGSVGSPMPTEPPTPFPKDDFEQQAINCFLNVKASLALGNGTPRDIVKLTWYIPNYEASYRDILINATRNFFADYDGHAPPSTLVGVKDLALPWYKAELEAVAAIELVGKIEECKSDSNEGDIPPHIVELTGHDEFSPSAFLIRRWEWCIGVVVIL
ncbi:hypothetical protein IQ07DRAFT_628773 [Pyrenochaeta sp. DS3sAY3a]|nr:hypothetical protein IQ07DRAFT_628773 [Pyrenochaeta sp. DS3sAY3a]